MSKVHSDSDSWKTKPTDRFVLKWIKCHLSAHITPKLVVLPWLRPWMITIVSTCLGVLGGCVFAIGWAWLAGLISASSQIMDGVDGQFARLTGRESKAGAFLDSVLDRYPDGAMVIGMVIYLIRLPVAFPLWLTLVLGYLALIGSNQISYSTARAGGLGIDLGKPTLASKGTRTSVMIICALFAPFWPSMPLLALCYLVVHPNVVILKRLVGAYRYRNTSTKSRA
ncbi:MAG: CDP-alcohol phosphatidyltransferase family protein [Thermodesulfobacteriota bacterium]|nr:CDP-alcohol phosphatidyltransferase family protein [Thermodesulfobacteriota bacterium]